ncbi:putative immunity/bacteriocin fusion bifunctional protein [Staphylococcus ratti]|nr:putative immunity/bacteriocin fusion bifunctional protein [Staphylococcus ratti]
MSKEEIKFVQNLKDKDKTIKNFENQMKKVGFKEIKLDDKNSKLKYISKKAKEKDVYGFIVNTAYKNEKTKEIVVSETIYDSYNKKITKFVAGKQKMEKNAKDKILVNKNYIEKKDSTTYGFTWNGKAFACSMGGLLACAHYCGIWLIVNPIAGGTCQAVCGTAFAAACSL